MKILLIEDNDIKFGVLKSWLNERFASASIHRSASYQTGVKSLLSGGYDWALLDMTLPARDDQSGVLSREPLTFGGELILREIARKGVNAKIIVVSQYKTFLRDGILVSFEQLREELLVSYPGMVIACVRLETGHIDWKVTIENILKEYEITDR